MADRTEQVHVRVTEKRKNAWRDAADARDQRLAAFVRWCVDTYISGDNGGQSAADAAVATDGSIDELTEEIQSLRAAIDGGAGSLSHRLQAIEGELRDDPATRELATEIYSALPSQDDFRANSPETPGQSPGFDAELFASTGVVTGKPADIAVFLDENQDDVEHALRELQSDLHNVHETNGRYYRS